MRIGVTGAAGLIGWHMRAKLKVREAVEVVAVGREAFASEAPLDEFVAGCDAIVHLAGMNRGDDADIEAVNVGLAQSLVAACERTGSRPHILFSSSTHVERDTAYGRSKRRAGEVFASWEASGGGRFGNLILPHVYGECGKPFYNSVVSTFCHLLASGGTPTIDHDGALELLHAQEVADVVLEAIETGRAGEIRPRGVPISVSGMLERLRGMAKSYLEGVIPRFENDLDLRLFNTFRSYLYPAHYPRELVLHSDQRGSLFEAVKTDHGGQAFLSTTRPGITRGNHFHFNKVERFLVVQGEAVIRLRKLFSDEVVEFPVSGDRPAYVDMPTLHTHSITNVGSSELVTLFWAHEIFDKNHPDTYFEPVLPDEAG